MFKFASLKSERCDVAPREDGASVEDTDDHEHQAGTVHQSLMSKRLIYSSLIPSAKSILALLYDTI
jgi:hypothetical protein